MHHHHYLIIGLYFEIEQNWVQCVAKYKGLLVGVGWHGMPESIPGAIYYRGASGAEASAGGPRSASLIRN